MRVVEGEKVIKVPDFVEEGIEDVGVLVLPLKRVRVAAACPHEPLHPRAPGLYPLLSAECSACSGRPPGRTDPPHGPHPPSGAGGAHHWPLRRAARPPVQAGPGGPHLPFAICKGLGTTIAASNTANQTTHHNRAVAGHAAVIPAAHAPSSTLHRTTIPALALPRPSLPPRSTPRPPRPPSSPTRSAS